MEKITGKSTDILIIDDMVTDAIARNKLERVKEWFDNRLGKDNNYPEQLRELSDRLATMERQETIQYKGIGLV